MDTATYREGFLPLRFFLASIVVHCPACYGKGFIKTNIPLVKEQEVVNFLFNDAGTISFHHRSEYDIWWKETAIARFTCTVCPKYMDWDPGSPLKTWHGPLKSSASSFCAQCETNEHQQLLTQKIYVPKSKDTKLPSETILRCPKCLTQTTTIWEYGQDKNSKQAIDPIFGCELFLKIYFGEKILWGYNQEHLEHIRAYVNALQRKKAYWIEHASGTYLDKFTEFRDQILTFSQILPAWVRLKTNREKVLKKLDIFLEELRK